MTIVKGHYFLLLSVCPSACPSVCPLHRWYKMLTSSKKIILDKITAFSTLIDNFGARSKYGVASLCNQLLSGFSSNPFETLHRCYKHIEHVHETFCRKKEFSFFTKLWHFSTKTILRLTVNIGIASLYNSFLPGFSSNQFETLHRCYKFIKHVHVTFLRRKNNF